MKLPRVRIGVSACLLGQEVRYDGGHKRDPFIMGLLARFADFAPVCPEVAVGLGVPRSPVRLVGDPGQPRAVGSKDPAMDFTDALEAFGRQRSADSSGISGYILKSASPSCGMREVKVYEPEAGLVRGEGRGIFARILTDRLPALPVEEECRLGEPALRESFLTRVFVYHRWLALRAQGIDVDGLARFHGDNRYLIVAHSNTDPGLIDQSLAGLCGTNRQVSGERYIRALMNTLTRPADRNGHADALGSILAVLAPVLGKRTASRLIAAIESFRSGEVGWLVPADILRHHLARHPEPDAAIRIYLRPFPDELALLNDI